MAKLGTNELCLSQKIFLWQVEDYLLYSAGPVCPKDYNDMTYVCIRSFYVFKIKKMTPPTDNHRGGQHLSPQ